jgi:carbohydrate kinase (thermoresistant glucokinase family)
MSDQIRNQALFPPRWVVMGVSGCGKSLIGSLLAQRLGVPHVEGDAEHPLAKIEKMSAGIPLTDDDRTGWLMILQARVKQAKEEGRGMVLSCSSLKRRYRDLLRDGDPGLVFLHLVGDRALITERMRARSNHFMPLDLLDSQFRDLEPLQPDERGIAVSIVLTPEQIVDEALAASI